MVIRGRHQPLPTRICCLVPTGVPHSSSLLAVVIAHVLAACSLLGSWLRGHMPREVTTALCKHPGCVSHPTSSKPCVLTDLLCLLLQFPQFRHGSGAVGSIESLAIGNRAGSWQLAAFHAAPEFADATPHDQLRLGEQTWGGGITHSLRACRHGNVRKLLCVGTTKTRGWDERHCALAGKIAGLKTTD